MHPPTLLTEYKFHCDLPLCTLSVPVAELAKRFGLKLDQWDEPGLGRGIGFGCTLASDLVMFLEEYEHARTHLGSPGPTVHIEASEMVTRGVDKALQEVLVGLGLTRTDVAWSQSQDGLETARQRIQAAQARSPSSDA
jgi:hypothetical protein